MKEEMVWLHFFFSRQLKFKAQRNISELFLCNFNHKRDFKKIIQQLC